MPVTKTAKRALKSSKRKEAINKKILSGLDSAIRIAKRDKVKSSIKKASSLADRAAKKRVIHQNKAARIKASLSKLAKKTKRPNATKKAPSKKK